MSSISERQLVHAPLPSADRLLSAYLAAHRTTKGDGARLILHAANLSEPAIVSVAGAHRPADMTPRYAVHWEAEHGEGFPVFDGTLTIDADEDYTAFWLVLEGTYEPPGGLAGKTFDVLLGHRIAAETARNLLGAIREDTETAFAAEERSKRKG